MRSPRCLSFAALTLLAPLGPPAAAQGLACRDLPASAGLPPAACLSAVAPLDAPTVSGLTGSHFGFEAIEDEYVRIGSGFTVIGPASTPSYIDAADFRDDDPSTWYALNVSGRAYTVDASTGTETALGSVAPAMHWGELAWDPTTDQFFAIASDCATGTSLYTIDFSTRTAALIGADPSVACGVGLAIDPNTGMAYVHDIDADAIYTMNKAAGTATLLGHTGFDGNYAQSMDFDDDSGVLYLYAFNNANFRAELRTVDPSTGATTLVSTLGDQARNITAASSAPLPSVGVEPPPDAALGLTVHPNPVPGAGTLHLTLGRPGRARVSVYDTLGREVAVLLNRPFEAGTHRLGFDVGSLPAGPYVWRLVVGGEVETGRMTLVR